MSSKILIIEDMEEMSQLMSLYITKAGMEAVTAASAEAALETLKSMTPDLILLDINLPGISGFSFLKTFREQFSQTIPVIVVSARDADEDIIEGLNQGADEFVTKPFSPRVLIARIESKLKRQAETTAAAEETYKFGEYTVLLNSCVLKKQNEKIPLSTKEYEVLEYLIKNEGKVLSPEQIYKDVWKMQYGDVTAVAVYIQRLRKKLEENPSEPEYFLTVFGKGYKFTKG